MNLVDVLIEVFEKQGFDESKISNESAQAIASDLTDRLELLDKRSYWSTEAVELLNQVLPKLTSLKEDYAVNEQLRIEIGVLKFKIEELLLKN